MTEYVSAALPSAAFFDLDRTLIAGSSAFALARAARSMKMMPTHELLRDAVAAATFKFRGDHDTGTSDAARDRILGFVKGQRQDDLTALNEQVLPGPARQDPPRGPTPRRHPSIRRAVDVHRVGGTAGDRRTAGRLARHDRRHRHGRRSRRRRLHGRPRGPVLLRRGQGHRDYRARPLGRPRPVAVLRLQRLGLRSPDVECGRAPRSRQPRQQARAPRPSARVAGRDLQSTTKTVVRRTVAGVASAGLAAGTFAAGLELGTRRARRRWLR